MKTMSGDNWECSHCGHGTFRDHLTKGWICGQCGYGRHPQAVPTEQYPTCGSDATPVEIGSSTYACPICNTEFDVCPTCGTRTEA
jgi:ribosomal protein S27AE